MKKIVKNSAYAALSTSSYEAPAVTVVEVLSEGVLCASGQLENWEKGDEFTWDE